jgi:hypothetical protein
LSAYLPRRRHQQGRRLHRGCPQGWWFCDP